MLLGVNVMLLAALAAAQTTKDVELSVRDVVSMESAADVTYAYATKAVHHSGVLAMLAAAVAKADALGEPECVVIVDVSGEVLGKIRMTGAKFLSLQTAHAKARSAASSGRPTHVLDEALRAPLAAATHGDLTALPGGLPIRIDGILVGGVGVGSAHGRTDLQVANAALLAIGALTYDGDDSS
mmetsp:Transcript_11955/g.35936  ORF Transcript_11955/g.35936 Transcript_11955/m.35936 type:complete len:183 (+) Transcript_11955:53-601(+)